ncbi:Copper chaperone domain-containing protein [Dioscorea alata]|uniref:Heavy metal-associated isoprenylated plant protein 30-like n=2 Tax=Dioscorea TaxID=4672 RepID=A0AB40CCX4_DIOCR|nr:heavy metal-associated isoprenylated plant protein 30-like [Dioscorea cayenensis subsp. rotundata]KAH7664476.1 Copper chaperone domain-containing protein [Dioscorea alata]
MPTPLGRTINSFFSTIEHCFTIKPSKHHPTTSYINYYQRSSFDMPKGRPLSLQTTVLKVRMCCAGCERVVKNAILHLRGVDSVEVDLAMEKVTVTGYIDRNKILKAVRRSGKKAEFWPNPDIPLYFTSAKNYWRDEESFRESYNYYRHGYNGDKHGNVPVPHRGEDPVSNMFNDDDVNACSVM